MHNSHNLNWNSSCMSSSQKVYKDCLPILKWKCKVDFPVSVHNLCNTILLYCNIQWVKQKKKSIYCNHRIIYIPNETIQLAFNMIYLCVFVAQECSQWHFFVIICAVCKCKWELSLGFLFSVNNVIYLQSQTLHLSANVVFEWEFNAVLFAHERHKMFPIMPW